MFASLPDVERDVGQMLAEGRMNDALANVLVGVHNHFLQSDVARKFLYYDKLDAHLLTMAQSLRDSMRVATPGAVGRNTLILATDLYEVGGHSRVILDVVRAVPFPTVVLTDMFWLNRKAPDRLNWLLEQLKDVTLIVLPQLSLWEKCRALFLLTQRLQPSNILYFNHHEDPIPFIGTMGHAGSRKTLVHHGDHNPSLGNTLPGIGHLDFTDEMAQACAVHLRRPTDVLPLFVHDGGCKQFSPSGPFSVVSSGADHKYARTGDFAYQRIIRTALECVDGNFFHIGQMDALWIEEIRSHLVASGLDGRRFVNLGPVLSVWATLAVLDAHLYISSAPVGGGRAAIEAQGCGYPVAFFRIQGQGPSLDAESLYASRELGWTGVESLPGLLADARARHALLSRQARALYDSKFSHAEFLRVLNRVLCG